MKDFASGDWSQNINVRDFVQRNYTQHNDDERFLAPATERTTKLFQKLLILRKAEQQKGILDLDTEIPAGITTHKPGYLDQTSELIVGLQTDAPLKRAMMPNGGIRLVKRAAEAFGYTVSPELLDIYKFYRKSHNDGVFGVYTELQKLLRKKHVILGLPDNYARGRIIGDYRRVALYGVTRLIEDRNDFLKNMPIEMTAENVRTREEVFEQIKALTELQEMAAGYGFDISKPAQDSREAIQWTYFAYLAAIKQQDGAAMSIGKLDTFFDCYIERDLNNGTYTESQVQEFIDDFVIKLRMVRFLRTPEYNELYAGDPVWVTMVLGGTGIDGRHMVTKTSYRILHTLTNLGPAPEPNLTVLWGKALPDQWKLYCAKQSIRSSSIQYENDDLMKPYFGDDYGIACCVSAMRIGKDMQFFGARSNIAKALLLAINGGKEEPVEAPTEPVGKVTDDTPEPTEGGDVIIPGLAPLTKREVLDYDEVWAQYKLVLDWLAENYVNTMNIIHAMHDKYHYESLEMALHDPQVRRLMAFGIAGLSIVADSLSAIKYAQVKPVWNDRGVAKSYEVTGEFPKFGNDDDRVDSIAQDVASYFMTCLRKYPTYRNAVHTLSILTITSNVVYGEATGSTPDGRKSGQPFAPGANPMHGRDTHGAVASLNSVAKIKYEYCLDGISNTFSIVPDSLGKGFAEQVVNLTQLLDGYFIGKEAHHLNVNVLNRETLLDAQKHPEQYPQLTIRVSGYAVLFTNLSKKQQDEVIARTFHKQLSGTIPQAS